MTFNRLRAAPTQLALVLAASVVLMAEPAFAAFGTRVLTAVEPDDPFPDIWIGVGFEHHRRSAKITRELVRDENEVRAADDVRELDFSEYTHRLLVDLRVGIFHDLELRVAAPFILENRSEIGFQDGVEGRSSIWDDRIPTRANNPAVPWAYPLTEVPGERERAGLGDMVFGLGWSPFVEDKDPSYPTLTLRVDLTVPTGARRDPADPQSLPGVNGTGGVGLGQTIFDFSLGLSRQIGRKAPTLDPYILLGARLPIAMGVQDRAGLEPPPSGRFKVGSELVISDNPDRGTRYAFDLGFSVRYVASGRTYSELSDYLPNFDQTRLPNEPVYDDYDNPANYDAARVGSQCGILENVPCGELNQVEEHIQLSGTFAIHIQPVKWLLFRGGITVGLVNDHLITAEPAGEDSDPASAAGATCPADDPNSPCLGRVNAENSQGIDERSRFYDPRYDQPGRRLRAEGILDLNAFVTTTLTF